MLLNQRWGIPRLFIKTTFQAWRRLWSDLPTCCTDASVSSTVVPDEVFYFFFFINWKNHHVPAPASLHWCFYQNRDWKSDGVTKTDEESGRAWAGVTLPLNFGLVCDRVVLMSAWFLIFILKFLICLVWKVKHLYTICEAMDGWMDVFKATFVVHLCVDVYWALPWCVGASDGLAALRRTCSVWSNCSCPPGPGYPSALPSYKHYSRGSVWLLGLRRV